MKIEFELSSLQSLYPKSTLLTIYGDSYQEVFASYEKLMPLFKRNWIVTYHPKLARLNEYKIEVLLKGE